MGLGKTVITLTAVNDLRFNRFAVRKVLVIAPKKVAEDTWTRESQKWDQLKDASGDPSPWKYQTADQSDQHTRRYLGGYQETMSHGWLTITKMTGHLTW